MDINFIYLVGDNTPSFKLIHYIVVKSWLVNNPSYTAIIWTNTPPTYAPWWWRLLEEFKDRIKVVDPEGLIKTIPEGLRGPFNQSKYIAHQADILRLQALYINGGIYCDLDQICLHSFEKIFTGIKPVYPTELAPDGHFNGIPNGLFYAPAHSKWIMDCMDFYKNYNPDEWRSTSIDGPTDMYFEDRSRITTIPAGMIDPVSWTYRDWQAFFMHDGFLCNSDIWAVHVSESATKNILKLIDLTHIMTVNTNFTRVVRQFVECWWDKDNNCAKISAYEW